MKKSFIYKKISNRIEILIQNGSLKPGDKLDSVRTLSKEKKISQTTAFRIYEELVIKDLIEARPKSGYYVKFKRQKPPRKLLFSNIGSQPMSREPSKILEYANLKFSSKSGAKFSSKPDISLVPIEKLNKSMNDAIRLSGDGCLNYENVIGNVDLRRQIARQTFGWNGNYNSSDVIITQGCIESLMLSLMTLTKPGESIIIEKPTFFCIHGIAKNLGLKIIEINTHPINGINLSYIEECIKKTKISACVFITNFSNPSGFCMSNEEKEKLVGILANADVPLIEDDISGDIYFGDSRPLTCKTFDKKGMVMLCSSFSKTLAPGYRIGWCLPGKFKEKFLQIKLSHSPSSASPTQTAIAKFFDTVRYDLYMKKLRNSLLTSLKMYVKAIESYFPPGTKVSNPKGGLEMWVELDNKSDAINLFYLAANKGLNIYPGPVFSVSGGFENFFRIGIGTPFNEKVESNLRMLGNLAYTEYNKTHKINLRNKPLSLIC